MFAFFVNYQVIKVSRGPMVKVSAWEPEYRGLEHHTGHDHDSPYDTSTGWFQEADSRVIKIRCENLFHIRAKNKSDYLSINKKANILITEFQFIKEYLRK